MPLPSTQGNDSPPQQNNPTPSFEVQSRKEVPTTQDHVEHAIGRSITFAHEYENATLIIPKIERQDPKVYGDGKISVDGEYGTVTLTATNRDRYFIDKDLSVTLIKENGDISRYGMVMWDRNDTRTEPFDLGNGNQVIVTTEKGLITKIGLLQEGSDKPIEYETNFLHKDPISTDTWWKTLENESLVKTDTSPSNSTNTEAQISTPRLDV